ncbi:MAG: O-Antigen ligase [Verrucomicrobia bacterium]|nr:MAG: O-Antigen ligase [Verrucomicrobiota bacterium]
MAPFGLMYAALFWSVSLQVPWVPLVLIFGLAPFQNDVSSVGWLHFSLAEVHLFLSAPLLIYKSWRGSLGWMSLELWGGLFLTLLLTLPSWRETSAVSLVQMGLYWIGAVAVFSTLPRRRSDFEAAWSALICVGCVLAGGAVLYRASYFWGLHKNGLGASLASAFIVAVECWSTAEKRSQPIYLGALLLISSGLVLVLSRGAWLAAAVGVCFLLAWRGQYLRLFLLGILLVPVVAIIWTLLPDQSKEYATSFDANRYNIKARVLNTEWAIEQWRGSPLLGVGAGLRKEYDATNVLWLTLAETGPLGLLAFIIVHGRLVVGVWHRRVWRMPGVGSPLALAGALVVAKFVHGMVDHYWSRGAIMIAWASVGMALWEGDCASPKAVGAARKGRQKPVFGPLPETK